jgi:hypothetical protein
MVTQRHLLSLSILVLGMASPAFSQVSGPPPTIIIPTQTPGNQAPMLVPIQVPGAMQPPGSVAQPTITPVQSPGVILSPVIAPTQPPTMPTGYGQPQLTPLPANFAAQLTQWGFTPIPCVVGVATIRLTDSTVCVAPTPRLPVGDYLYNPALNQISPVKVARPFEFKNPKEYGDCVEDILRFHSNKEQFMQQGRASNCLSDVFEANASTGISKAQGLKMIQDANFYATSLLTSKLFPPRGQRIRVAQTFGFIYEVDANNEMIQRAAQSPKDAKSQ